MSGERMWQVEFRVVDTDFNNPKPWAVRIDITKKLFDVLSEIRFLRERMAISPDSYNYSLLRDAQAKRDRMVDLLARIATNALYNHLETL